MGRDEFMCEINKTAMEKAIEESKINYENSYQKGGPFGAVIVKNNEVICSSHNTVVESNDPTAHAEINCIRKACKILNTYDLSGCILYVNAEPCPMCLSAIIWSNIKEVYFANTKKDADEIGFRDDMIYEFFNGKNTSILKVHHIDNKEAKEVFKKFKEMPDKIIY